MRNNLSDKVKQLERENESLKLVLKLTENLARERGTCGNCKYYIAHYVKHAYRKTEFDKLTCGHCIQGNGGKNRKETQSCDHFERGEYNHLYNDFWNDIRKLTKQINERRNKQ